MSDKLIKLSDAIEAVYQLRHKPNDEEWNRWLESLNSIPPADRPRGEWIDNGDRYFRCSLCGTKDTDKWHWCHGCGHPMKGADDD